MSQPAAPPEVPAEQSPPAVAVIPASPAGPPAVVVASEPRRGQSPIWRALKWPLRQGIKAIYLVLAFLRRHKRVTIPAILVLLLAAGGAYGVYRATHADPLVNVESASTPDVPSSVRHALHGFQTYNGREFWDSLSLNYQAALLAQGEDATTFESQFTQARASGVVWRRFVQTGGFQAADGTSYYTVQAIAEVSGQQVQGTLYFAVDQSGAINYYQALPHTPPTQATPAGG